MEMKEDRPAYVRFTVKAVEDRNATIERGVYTTRDVEYALVTPPYSKDCVQIEVKEWMDRMELDVKAQRLPPAWRDNYKRAYDHWKKGVEIPLEGTPIKGWQLLSPAQQTNLVSIGFYTVEDLAGMNDEGRRRYGMGANDMQNKAKAWLQASKSAGVVTQENAALKAHVEALEEQNKILREHLKSLADKESPPAPVFDAPVAMVKRGPGRPKKLAVAA